MIQTLAKARFPHKQALTALRQHITPASACKKPGSTAPYKRSQSPYTCHLQEHISRRHANPSGQKLTRCPQPQRPKACRPLPTDMPTTRQAWRPCRQAYRQTSRLPRRHVAHACRHAAPVSRALCAGTAQMTHLLAQAPLTKQQRQPLIRSDSCLCIRQITACYATSSRLAAACCHAAAARDVTRAQGPLSWHRARQGCAMGRACAGHYGAYFSLTLTTARFCPFMASSSYTSLAI